MSDVIMRCNVSAGVGMGHLMRCRTLAHALGGLGHRAHLIGPPEELRIPDDDVLFASFVPVLDRGSSAKDAARVIALAEATGARHLIMDDYRCDPDYQLLLQDAGLRWLQQFDASRPFAFWSPVLVNAGPAERREDYREWLKAPEQTVTLFGPRYAVLRPAFTALTPRELGRPVSRVLVSFGGGDDRGAVARALNALAPLPIEVIVISGPANPRNETNAEAAQAAGAQHHVAPSDMAALMASCDLALIGGGTMSYEAAICGLPMILSPLAPNQLRACQGWADQAGAMVLDGPDTLNETPLRDAVETLLADTPRRTDMATRGAALVDGQGGARLLEALFKTEGS